MSFWEFAAACEGFESFHAAPDKDAGPGAPSADEYWAAVGGAPP